MEPTALSTLLVLLTNELATLFISLKQESKFMLQIIEKSYSTGSY
jgi:hypothetical protein